MPDDLNPSDERLAFMVLCRSIRDITDHFSELKYSEEDDTVLCAAPKI